MPQLDVILCGENPASVLYVNHKRKYCEDIGTKFNLHKIAPNLDELEQKIYALNADPNVKAFFVQLPLPNEIRGKTQETLDNIDPNKDVDCLTSTRLGEIVSNKASSILPGTVRGIIRLLEETKTEFKSKNIVIINNSIVVGKPLAMFLSAQGATVTICNEFTKDLSAFTNRADILITATGVPHLIKANMIKEASIIIDAGIAVVDGKTTGDVDFESALEKAAYITPVPGGVGPMTIASVVQNLLDLYTHNVNKK